MFEILVTSDTSSLKRCYSLCFSLLRAGEEFADYVAGKKPPSRHSGAGLPRRPEWSFFRALPIVAPITFLYGMLANTQDLPEPVDWLFYSVAQSIVTVVAVGALASAVFAPRAPQWRLVATSDAGAVRLCGLVILLAFIYSLTAVLYLITRLVQAPFALTIAVALPSSLLIASLVVALLRTPFAATKETAPPRVFKLIRMVVWAIAGAIVVCAVAGYLPLARFLSQQLIVTGSILALVYILLLWVDGFAQGL